jgi:TonB family protein
MPDRIQSHFAERARNARRLSLLAATIGLGMFLALGLGRVGPIQRALNDPKRWGFEGPEQYVRRITLARPPGGAQALRDVGEVRERSTRRGGSPTPAASRSPTAVPKTRPRLLGPGDATEDLIARAVSSRPDLQVVQSEDVVAINVVQPVYPRRAYDDDIEGRVAAVALLDTTGRVIEVQVQVLMENPAVGRDLGEAVSDAVWRSKFRPYRVQGAAIEVWVKFTYNFTINRSLQIR